MSERTSARVARIAGRILRATKTSCRTKVFIGEFKDGKAAFISMDELRALAASALTQTEAKRK